MSILFAKIMRAEKAWRKAYDREVKLRYQVRDLKKEYKLANNEAKIDTFEGDTYVITKGDYTQDYMIQITKVNQE